MKTKTILTTIFFLTFSAVALIAGSFSLALLCRLVARAWRIGWSLLALAFVLTFGSNVTFATPVSFPLVGITGSANNRDITIVPDVATNVLVYGSNLVSLQTLLIHPVRGNSTNELLPWGYTLRIDGWPRSAHFVVPNQTNVVNVITLITNATALGFPIYLGGNNGTATNINNAAGTNVNISGNFAGSVHVGSGIYGIGTNLLLDASGNFFGSLSPQVLQNGADNPYGDAAYGGTLNLANGGNGTGGGGGGGTVNIAIGGSGIGGANGPGGTVNIGLGSIIGNVNLGNVNFEGTVSGGGVLLSGSVIRPNSVGSDVVANSFTTENSPGGPLDSIVGESSANDSFQGHIMLSSFYGTYSGMTPLPNGVTTNLQFTFSNTRTNTLYFTNGVLMRVSQP